MSKPVMIDSDNSGRYIVLAAAKSVAGIGVLKLITEHNRAHAVFRVMSIATPKLWWGVQGRLRSGRVR